MNWVTDTLGWMTEHELAVSAIAALIAIFAVLLAVANRAFGLLLAHRPASSDLPYWECPRADRLPFVTRQSIRNG